MRRHGNILGKQEMSKNFAAFSLLAELNYTRKNRREGEHRIKKSLKID